MKINKVSDLFKVENNQSVLEYANICIDGSDNRLYVDPIQISGNDDALSKRCHLIIEDFFNVIFNHLKNDRNFKTKGLLDKSKEKNSLRLGKAEIIPDVLASGTGCSAEMLYTLFTRVNIRNLVKEDIIKKPMDTVLFIKGFNEDRMSDLIVSLIFKELVYFTNKQASTSTQKIATRKMSGTFWNHMTHRWEKFEYEQLLDLKKRPLTLVPKNFVTDKYVYRAERYIQSCLMVHEQKLRQKKNPDSKPINKKDLYNELKNSLGLTGTEFIIQYTLCNIEENLIEQFRRANEHNSKGKYRGKLTDDELTTIIEKPYMDVDNLR